MTKNRTFIQKAFRKAAKGLREAGGSAFEGVQLWRKWDDIKPHLPRGEGRLPVLLVQGLGHDDWYMNPTETCLKDLGHSVYKWGAGVNKGFRADLVRSLEKRMEDIVAENGGRRLRVVAHSFGGTLAKEVARVRPDLCERVITLGTPTSNICHPGAISRTFHAIYKKFNSEVSAYLSNKHVVSRIGTPLHDVGVFVTSIFATEDKVVHHKTALLPKTEFTENIRIRSTHTGMPWNIQALTILADQLSLPEDVKQPFDKRNYWHLNIGFPEDLPDSELPENPGWKPEDAPGMRFYGLELPRFR